MMAINWPLRLLKIALTVFGVKLMIEGHAIYGGAMLAYGSAMNEWTVKR